MFFEQKVWLYVTLFAIWAYLYIFFKKVKNTQEEVLLLVKLLQPVTPLKVTHWVFSRILNCTNDAKPRKSYITSNFSLNYFASKKFYPNSKDFQKTYVLAVYFRKIFWGRQINCRRGYENEVRKKMQPLEVYGRHCQMSTWYSRAVYLLEHNCWIS